MKTIGTFGPTQEDPWDPATVGQQIRILRQEREITPGQLATACHVTPAYIYQIERGLLLPSLRIIGDICQILQVHPRDLFV